jgi:hypothetical protein
LRGCNNSFWITLLVLAAFSGGFFLDNMRKLIFGLHRYRQFWSGALFRTSGFNGDRKRYEFNPSVVCLAGKRIVLINRHVG